MTVSEESGRLAREFVRDLPTEVFLRLLDSELRLMLIGKVAEVIERSWQQGYNDAKMEQRLSSMSSGVDK